MMRNYEILNLWKFAFNLLNIGDELLRLVNLFLGVFEHFFFEFFRTDVSDQIFIKSCLLI